MAGWCCVASSLCPLLRTWKFCVPQQIPEMLLLTDTPKAHEIFFTLLHKALQFRGQSVLSTTWVKKAVPDRQSSALPQACPEVLPSQEIILKITLTLFNVR